MILCDDIMANTDRHWRNFGLIRDVETLEYRTAPLFDTGSSLWCRVPTRELAYTPFVVDMRPFYEDSDRQLRLVGDTSWLNLDKLAGFPEWASDFLDENPSMYGRTDFIYEGLQKRIDYLELLFGQKQGTSKCHLSLVPEKHPQRHRGKSPKLLLPCRLGS